MTYRLSKLAATDVDLIAGFYAANNWTAAVRFIDAVFGAIRLLEANPRMGVSLTSGGRRLVLKGFPYSLIYQLAEGDAEIVVLAVTHHSRHPNYGQNRVREGGAVYQLAA